MSRRVVITGLGLVTPLGLDHVSTWQGLLEGRNGVVPISKFDTEGFSSRIGGEVRGFDPTDYVARKEARKMDTFCHYAIAAAREALDDAAFTIDASNADDVGVYIGSGIGGLALLEKTHRAVLERGVRRISPFFIPGMILNLATGNVSIIVGAKGPNLALATACATGTHAIGESYRLIKEDYCEAMIAGGTEASITPLAVGGFCAMKAPSTRNDEPERASRPFDVGRDGFVVGEGAGIVILEERAGALRRGARIYAEITGYGLSGDAYHISAPAEDGNGAIRAMKMALDRAGARPEEVDYVNAHGTSTPAGDPAEIRAMKKVFGDHPRSKIAKLVRIAVNNLLGAAGGLETAASALSVFHDVIPPTINLEQPDPECDLDCVPGKARKTTVRTAMNNSFGFGGTNATLLISKHRDD